jgi:hypothetical protein
MIFRIEENNIYKDVICYKEFERRNGKFNTSQYFKANAK